MKTIISNNKTMEKKDIPIVGKEYHFFDDGKIRESRHYTAVIDEIIPIDEAKNIVVYTPREFDYETNQNIFIYMTLYDVWIDEKDRCDWIYADDTDYIIKARIPKYDKDPIYFAKTKDDGWFSMDVTNWWQSGRLDIDGKLYEDMTLIYQ